MAGFRQTFEQSDKDTDDKVQLLLESMVVMLGNIAQSYDKYVIMHEQLL